MSQFILELLPTLGFYISILLTYYFSFKKQPEKKFLTKKKKYMTRCTEIDKFLLYLQACLKSYEPV